MPTHASLSGADLHEPKGADSANADEVIVADGVGGTSWISPSDVVRPYGELYTTLSDGATQSGIGTTPIKFTGWGHEDISSPGVSLSSVNNEITIDESGVYLLDFSGSIATTSAGDSGLYTFEFRKNAIATGAIVRREMSGSSDTGSLGFNTLANLVATDVVSLWVESDNGANTDNLNIDAMNLTLVKVSG